MANSDEMPVSLRYGRAVDDLRRRYHEWIWDAEFQDTHGARVTVNGTPLSTYTVYRRQDGRRAVGFANMSDTDPIELTARAFSRRRKAVESARPAPVQPDEKPWPGKLEMAPASVAVILEG